ncbi:pentapeptide repeat-containing protein [Streptomyces triticirhizae]|uniref:Pentapeptide repeat-containing protein n=1 Tax=Streptomyces triticirhizae TaxID=2483353 RepID=A0A3M2M614_9ACTN|nr:pentapeptide repeat-containing protein [Streptomyces triticirhizae]RMI45224.1 pentapeptide repeat-containing protein [Streptomyces triticirhizae]
MLVTVASLGILCVLIFVLGPVSWWVAGETVKGLSGKERADAINAVRQTVLAALAGVTVLASLAYTARTYRLSRRGQVTERFRAAVENLASDKLEVRLGSVYSLEHILAESAVDHRAVVEVLAGFVRHRVRRSSAPEPMKPPEQRNSYQSDPPDWGEELSPDIQEAVEVLARRPRRAEPRRIDLRHTRLAGLSLRHFEFESAPRLEWMFLTGADLHRADLRGAHMRGTILNDADMRWAWLQDACCEGTQMAFVDFRGASLNGADFRRAFLRGADFREAGGLTAGQLAEAEIDDDTRLPEYLSDDPWVAARLADCAAWRETNSPHRRPPRTPPPPLV